MQDLGKFVWRDRRDRLLRSGEDGMWRQNELDGGDEDMALILAAGHGATHQGAAARMVALHRFFGSGGVRGVTVIRSGVTVSGAHAAGAAGHATSF